MNFLSILQKKENVCSKLFKKIFTFRKPYFFFVEVKNRKYLLGTSTFFYSEHFQRNHFKKIAIFKREEKRGRACISLTRKIHWFQYFYSVWNISLYIGNWESKNKTNQEKTRFKIIFDMFSKILSISEITIKLNHQVILRKMILFEVKKCNLQNY